VLKLQISLAGIVFACAFVEGAMAPAVWTPLRMDLVLGMVVGAVVHMGFSQGLLFVMISSMLLQAFTGARPGLVPLFYLTFFTAVHVLKDFIYLENPFTQALLSAVFFAAGVICCFLILDIAPEPPGMAALTAGCVLTGCAGPLMTGLVGRLKKAYGA
jgi:hypothetical protein